MKRFQRAPLSDVALLGVRLLLGVIMIAHGYQKLVVNGIGRTTAGFESMSIPLAIVSASFVTVVELVGGVLLVLGLMTRTIAACMGFVMAGAAAFVHARHGVFVADGGWELVGSIAAGLLALAVAGPGRLSVGHLVRARTQRPVAAVEPPRVPSPAAPVQAPVQEAVPPAGLPVTPLIQLGPNGPRPVVPRRFPEPVASGPLPVRRPGPPPPQMSR